MKRILVFGSTGQVGWELQRALAPLGEVVALDGQAMDRAINGRRRPAAISPGSIASRPLFARCDPTSSSTRRLTPRWTRRRRSAKRRTRSTPRRRASSPKACASTGALLVHYTTDYVFDGSGDARGAKRTPLRRSASTGTKLDGEPRIRESRCRHLIFRTSWVYARARRELRPDHAAAGVRARCS